MKAPVIGLLSLVTTKTSIITGNKSANELLQTAPIKLIKRPRLGTNIATPNVMRTIKALKETSPINGCLSAGLMTFRTDGNIICIGMKN